MHQVLVIDDAVVYVEQLVMALTSHHIVVVNCIMRGTAEKLRHEAEQVMKQSKSEGPYVDYNEFKITVEGEVWFAPTMAHSELNDLNLDDTWSLVERAMQVWVSRGQANRFLYTNRARHIVASSG
ncbi:hypothetical protein [Pseudomonas sp. zfem002]|uniref:hypothetical protein n=1 Tax=Pseudomonas sp. zfem002 TaxID=3078197 RepID=UPI002929AB98|nr:hypothetical protein [Pseudomonas sp. zfem002]MDU9393137.1 hypothetical protein [Pseudomonas sp. zfem002]